MEWGDCLEGVSGDIATLSCVMPLFKNIITAALGLAGLVALFFIIYAGIKLLLSSGDTKKVESARSTLIFAIIGLLLVFFSFAIVRLVGVLTGVECINMFGYNSCGDQTQYHR
jgi:heme O synthase-like polyprenyltransferase